MIRRNIALLLALLCIAPLHAGDFEDNEFFLPLDFPPLDVNSEYIILPRHSSENLSDNEFVHVNEYTLRDEQITKSPIKHQAPTPKSYSFVTKTVALKLNGLSNTNVNNTNTAQAVHHPWIDVTRSKTKLSRQKTESRMDDTNTDLGQKPLIEDEDSYEIYERRKKDGQYQYFLNHGYKGSYHTRLQEEARIAHILYKKTDINPPRAKK